MYYCYIYVSIVFSGMKSVRSYVEQRTGSGWERLLMNIAVKH